MSSPAPLLTIVATYLYFCAYAGPRYMKDRKPFDLKNLIILYNFVQVVMSIFLVYEVRIHLLFLIYINYFINNIINWNLGRTRRMV